MERRKCRRCGHPMTRIITQTIEPGGSHWKAYHTCISCGCETAAVTAKSREEAEKGLEDFAAMIDQEYKTADTRSDTPTKPRPAEADRLLKVYDLYFQLCEAMTGEPIANLDELLTAAQKAKRELEAYKGAGLRYEEEIARLKRMAAEDILRAAQSRCPCNSCTENPIDKGCTFEECEGCDHRCVCYECNDDASFVWRGGK